jgi:hypothetical protein
MLGDANSVTAIFRWGRDAPEEVLLALGVTGQRYAWLISLSPPATNGFPATTAAHSPCAVSPCELDQRFASKNPPGIWR